MKLTLAGLTKLYGWTGIPALQDVDLEISAGQIVAVVGANGAGKTTLLRLLSTLAAPSAGEILIDGERLARDRIDLRKRLFFMPEIPAVDNHLTIAQHLGVVLELYDALTPGIEEQALVVLEEFDLLPLVERQLRNLSRGECYKAALVPLILANIELWLLDEPFASGIDPRGITALRRHIREAAERGSTILFTTQILEIAEQLATHVCVLDGGKVHWYGAVRDLPGATGESSPLQAIFANLHAVT